MKEFIKENKVVLIGFALSLFHWTLATAFCVALLWFLRKEGIRGAIKAMIILGIRSNLGRSIASSFGAGGMIKFAVIFIIAFFLIHQSRAKNQKRLDNLLLLLGLYLFSNVITLVFVSSFPVTGLFKLISYSIPFYAILKGVGDDDQYDYLDYMLRWFTIILVGSLVAIPLGGRFNYVNGDFQGVLNHPNTFGLFGAVYVGLLVYQLAIGKIKFSEKKWIGLGVLALALMWLSRSRTGMFSAAFCCAIAFWTTQKMSIGKKVCLGMMIGILLVVYATMSVKGMNAVNKFVYKRGESEILSSREEMRIAYEEKYAYSPMLGTGFLVPFVEGYRNTSLSFNLIAEPGNLYYAVMGDSGIVGTTLFCLYVGYILFCCGMRKLELGVIPLIISMGEVAFFSTNNLAAWYYVIFGVCLAKNTPKIVYHVQGGRL